MTPSVMLFSFNFCPAIALSTHAGPHRFTKKRAWPRAPFLHLIDLCLPLDPFLLPFASRGGMPPALDSSFPGRGEGKTAPYSRFPAGSRCHNHGVHRVVELLKKCPDQNRKEKEEQLLPDDALRNAVFLQLLSRHSPVHACRPAQIHEKTCLAPRPLSSSYRPLFASGSFSFALCFPGRHAPGA